MKNRGIEHVQLYCVDNILVKIGDPLFTGYCIEKGAECANKVVPKGFPTESVGITAQVDGKYQVYFPYYLVKVICLTLIEIGLIMDHCFWTADYSGQSAYCGLALAFLLL